MLSGGLAGTAYPREASPEELRERFAEGRGHFDAGRYRQALSVFSAILAEDSQARGSLFLAATSHLQLDEFEEAAPLFDRFLRLEPRHLSGLIGAVKSHQHLGNDDQVARYRRVLLAMKAEGSDPRLEIMLNYERERIPVAAGATISIQEFFPAEDQREVFSGVLIEGKTAQRKVEWVLAQGTEEEALRDLYPQAGALPLFVLGETPPSGDALSDYALHDVHWGRLDFDRAREGILKVLSVETKKKRPRRMTEPL